MAKPIWKERKVVVSTLTGLGLLAGYGAIAPWPHLAGSFPILVTALVSIAAGFFGANVVAKKFEPKDPTPRGGP